MLTGARRYTVSSFPFATFLRNLGYPGQQRVVPIDELTTDTAEWAKDVAATVRVLYTIPRPLRLSTIIGRQIIGRRLRRMRERCAAAGGWATYVFYSADTVFVCQGFHASFARNGEIRKCNASWTCLAGVLTSLYGLCC